MLELLNHLLALPPLQRAMLSGLFAMGNILFLGKKFIQRMKHYQYLQEIRQEGPSSHQVKQGTPTLGGLLIWMSILLGTLCFSDLGNRQVWCSLLALCGFSAVGLVDDLLKLHHCRNCGLKPKQKYILLSWVALICLLTGYYWAIPSGSCHLLLPFWKMRIPLNFFSYSLIGYLALVGTSNAVNLTDGLDGLASVPVALVAFTLGCLLFSTGTPCQLPGYQSLELLPLLGAIIGSCCGFLWFNTYPALLFMGDTGSLGLGGTLAMVALLIGETLSLPIAGAVFVVETLSVILQVARFKLSGKRWFKMTPIHHHFELTGMPETRIVIRGWLLSLVAAILTLISTCFHLPCN